MSAIASSVRSWNWFGVTAVLFVVSYLAARLGVEAFPSGSPLKLVSALLPIVPYLLFLGAMVRGARELDELQRRCQLEALAFAFLTFMVVMMTLGLLELAIVLPPEDFSYRHVWAMMPVLYFLGLARAQRRYR
jgi:hypothetical protein